MAFNITSAINQIQNTWLTISGIRAAPDEPPESLAPFPIVVTFERYGHIDATRMYGSSWEPTDGTIWSELHIERKSLPQAIRTAMTFRDTFLQKFKTDSDLGHYVMTVKDVRWTLLPMEYAGIQTIGYRFEIDYTTEL